MQVLIVYESIFGNTHLVAEAVAAGIRAASPGAAVDCVPVSAASAGRVAAAGLLIVGGPTHMHGMTYSASRRDAARAPAKFAGENGEARPPTVDADAPGPGLRTWFHTFPARRGAHGLPRSTPGSTAVSRVVRPGASPAGCTATVTRSSRSPQASSSRTRRGRCARANSAGPAPGAPDC